MDAKQRILPIVFHALLLACTLHVGAGLALAQPGTRDLAPTARPGQDIVPIGGQYWALIIGIDQYQHPSVPPLTTAVNDAQAVREVLVQRYGFQRERIVELLNDQATGAAIQNELYKLGRRAGPEDSVFIYYAGHGQYDDEGELGWWVPVEADPKNPGTFIMDSTIVRYVKGMTAKHVYLVADSCFSGTLFGTRALPPIDDQWFSRLYAKSSRWALTSGSTEPVADRGKDGHSVFAYHFLTLLRENTDPYLVPSRIHDRLAPLVANNAEQTPRSEPLRRAGDEGGQFVLRLASAAGALEKQKREAEARMQEETMKTRVEKYLDAILEKKLAEQGGHRAEEEERLRVEAERLGEEKQRLEEARLANEQQRAGEGQRLRLEAERLAEGNRRLEEARLAEEQRRAQQEERLRFQAARLAEEKRRLKEEQESEDFSFSGGF